VKRVSCSLLLILSKLFRVKSAAWKVEFKFLLAVHKAFTIIVARYYVLVNNTVKALPKKRKHQMIRNLSVNISKASMLKHQALWYSAFIASYIWFMYWVSYDFFVWNKPIVEVNLTNLAGSVISLAFIWAGPTILKHNRTEARKLRRKSPPQKPSQKTPPANSTCTHYLGYLHQRQEKQEIPAECLTCENVIQCFSPTK
jgi:hypothetical protein